MTEIQPDILGRLFNVADDHELATLDDLAIRAGVIWQCHDQDCGWNNREDETKCGGCGLERGAWLCGECGVTLRAGEGDGDVCPRCEAGQDTETTGAGHAEV